MEEVCACLCGVGGMVVGVAEVCESEVALGAVSVVAGGGVVVVVVVVVAVVGVPVVCGVLGCGWGQDVGRVPRRMLQACLCV